MSIDKTAKDLMEALQQKPQPAGYDTQATVTRVEDDTLWVHIPGGVDETPVRKTVGASVGDVLQIRVAAGQAWAVGNASAPPTDDTRANEAMQQANSAQASANIAAEAASSALASAAEAADAASYAVAQSEVAAEAAQDAKEQAESATESATTALVQLSVVEDVVGTLNWISEHGVYAATTDTEVVHGKLYFTRSGSGTDEDPYVYNVVASPASDPSAAGYYELVSVDEAVGNYIATHLALTEEGLYVINDSNSWRVLIKNDGVYIVDTTGAIVAQYKNSVTIGKTNQSNVQIDYHSLQLVDKEGDPYFYVSDLRDVDDYYTAIDRFIGDGDETDYQLNYVADSFVSVTVDGVETSEYSYVNESGYRYVQFSTAPADQAEIVITYITSDQNATAFTFGNRALGSTIGGLSTSAGRLNISSGFCSHAEGFTTKAIGQNAHAEGFSTTASGDSSHAEGMETIASREGSHAEGSNTTASGHSSHAEGYGTIASGVGSHAEGYGTIASGHNSHAEGSNGTRASGYDSHAEGFNTLASGHRSHAEGVGTVTRGEGSHAEGHGTVANGQWQHVAGKYNAVDFVDEFVEIIGNGYNDYDRRNARTLDWDGNEVLAGGLTINGSTDVAKAIKSITRSGTTFTYTCLDGTTGTFTQLDPPSGVADAGNGRTITFRYSGDGISATSWLAAWNGYELNAISPANLRKLIGVDMFTAYNQTVTFNMLDGSGVVFAMRFPNLIDGYMFEYWNASIHKFIHAASGTLNVTKSGNSNTVTIPVPTTYGAVRLIGIGGYFS